MSAHHTAASALPAEDLDHVLTRVGDLWSQARGKRIFLTGGTGFFGPWLVDTFAHANRRLDLGAELVVLTRDPDAAIARLPQLAGHRAVTLHRGDVRAFERPRGEFHLVVHGAAESSQQGHVGDHRHMFDTIIDGTRRTLSFAQDVGASYLLVSSGAVYGQQPPTLDRVGEDHRGGPDISDARSAYAEGKRAAEVMAAIEADRGGPSVRIARCFAFVGAHLPLDAHFAIGNFIRDAASGGPIDVRGDGTAVRSYLYMADLAVWLWTLALSPFAHGAYNVGSEEPVSILETARAVAAVLAPDAAIRVHGTPADGVAPHRYVPSTARARGELSLRQHVELHDAIARTARWYGLALLPLER
jgi:dTDP-glucose 4,6-dehydratase